MSAVDAGQPPLHAHCAACGAAIRWGDMTVSVFRNEEQVCPDGDRDMGDRDLLARLCEACGKRYPPGAIRVLFGEQPPL